LDYGLEMNDAHAIGRPRTNRELRDLSLTRIFDSALTLFVTQGYRGTTVDQIAAGAGLTKGGVYFYIGKKERLLAQMIEQISGEYIDEIGARIDRDYTGAQDKLVSLIHWQVNYARDHPREVMLLVMSSIEFHRSEDPLAEKIASVYQRLHALVARVFEQGKSTGEFRHELRTRELASFYIAAHDGMMLEWYRRDREIDGGELVRAFRESLLHGIRR
jgi:AcrR family transcriptional regulator